MSEVTPEHSIEPKASRLSTKSISDIEKGDVVFINEKDPDSESSEGHVKRQLNSRQLQMIGFGGCLGTGIFLSLGESYSETGPLGLVLAFFIMGIVVYSVMVSLGEMTVLLSDCPGSFTHFASRFFSPSWAVATGWMYFFSDGITVAAELTAGALVISYWDADTNPAAYITVIFACVALINVFGVRWFGEAEFVFASLKIIACVGLIILSIVITSGGYPGSDVKGHEGHAIGFRYWRNPGPFLQMQYGDGQEIPGSKGRFLAFWDVFVITSYTYLGTEIVAMTAAESVNPDRDMPLAIRQVFYRILLFYVGSAFVLGLVLSPLDGNLLSAQAGSQSSQNGRSSPWVIAITESGINSLDHVINAVILIAAFSAGNSMLYGSSRTLYGLALDSKAPRFFRKCLPNGVPIWALLATSLFGFLAYLNADADTGAEVFNWFVALSSISGIMTWVSILATYARFYDGLKAQGIDRNTFGYKAPFQPYLTYFGILFLSCVVLFSGWSVFLEGNWDTATFVTNYLPFPLFFVVFFAWWIYSGDGLVKPSEMDFYTGRRSVASVLHDEEEHPAPKTLIGKFWHWLF